MRSGWRRHFLISLNLCMAQAVFAAQSINPSMPPLVAAAKVADWTHLETLLADGLDANAIYGDGTSALHWASYHESVAGANRLISAGANVNARTDLGVTPLWLAAENGNADLIKVLLQAGAEPNAVLHSGETLVMTASRSGNAEVITQLLAAGANPNAAVTRDQTALMWAANHGHSDVVEALLKFGADVHAQSLVRSQYVKTEKPQDSPPSYKVWVDQGGNTALMFAARSGDLRSAQLLLDAGGDVNTVSAYGTSPAIMAVHGGNAKLLAFLLENGAKTNDSTSGHTALHAAVLRGNYEAVEVLLDADADTEAKLLSSTPARRQSADYHFHEALIGATPLWLAARFAEPEIMNLLLEQGANALIVKDVSYPAQRTVAQIIAAQRRLERSSGSASRQPDSAKPSAENYIAEEGEISLLMAAVGMGHRRLRVSWGNPERRAGRLGRREEFILESTRVAVKAGVDINLRDATNQSALDFAKARRYKTVVSYLLEAGASEQ